MKFKMYTKKKELRLIREQKREILEQLKDTDFDSGEYERMCKALKKLTSIEEEIMNGRKTRSWLPLVLQVILGLLGIAAPVAGSVYLGQLSYENNTNSMNLKDGAVWNLSTNIMNKVNSLGKQNIV